MVPHAHPVDCTSEDKGLRRDDQSRLLFQAAAIQRMFTRKVNEKENRGESRTITRPGRSTLETMAFVLSTPSFGDLLQRRPVEVIQLLPLSPDRGHEIGLLKERKRSARCLVTDSRIMSKCSSSSLNLRPLSSCNRSSDRRRLGSASALSALSAPMAMG